MALAVGSCSGEDFALAQLLLNNSQAATTLCSSFNVSAYGGVSNAAMAYTISQVRPGAPGVHMTRMRPTCRATPAQSPSNIVEPSHACMCGGRFRLLRHPAWRKCSSSWMQPRRR